MNLALPVSVSGAFFTLFPTPFSCLSIGSQRAVTASALEIVLFWLVSVCVCVWMWMLIIWNWGTACWLLGQSNSSVSVVALVKTAATQQVSIVISLLLSAQLNHEPSAAIDFFLLFDLAVIGIVIHWLQALHTSTLVAKVVAVVWRREKRRAATLLPSLELLLSLNPLMLPFTSTKRENYCHKPY